MTEAEIIGGICGHKTVVRVEDQKKYRATCIIESSCPNYKKVSGILDGKTFDLMQELFKKGESQVLKACEGIVPHVSCPVPSGILKAMEVGVGLALPGDAAVTFTKADKPIKRIEK